MKYVIEAERVMNTTKRADGVFFTWPLHLAESHPSLLAGFREAFECAVRRRVRHVWGQAQLNRVWPGVAEAISEDFARAEATA